MSTLTLLRGYPGAGKSTMTKKLLVQRPGLVVLNRDDARASLFGRDGVLPPDQERIISDMHMTVARNVLQRGGDVLIDGTNLAMKFAKDWADLAVVTNSAFSWIDIDTDVDECVRRDAGRRAEGKRFVGEDIIRNFAKRYPQPWGPIIARTYSEPKWEKYEVVSGLPWVTICDLDGTIAIINGRGPYDTNYENDLPHQHVIDMIFTLWHGGEDLVFFSGRKEAGREGTQAWIQENAYLGPSQYKLYMRADDDNRKDDLVKFDLFNQHIRGKFNVTAVFDDRLQVCRMWHAMGLPLFRVGDPDASF